MDEVVGLWEYRRIRNRRVEAKMADKRFDRSGEGDSHFSRSMDSAADFVPIEVDSQGQPQGRTISDAGADTSTDD